MKLKYSPILLLVILGVIVLLSIENFLIFYPEQYPSGNWQPVGLSPEDVWIESEDGIKLHGWYLRAESPKAVAMYSHGNGGNITGLAAYMKILSEKLNISILAYDYRGYGRSNGSPSVKGVLIDAKAAANWLANRENLQTSDLIQIGRSLGGGVAAQTAIATGARGLILENTFTSLSDIGKAVYPWLPVKMLLRQDLNSLGAIPDYKGSLLVIHGDNDELIPYRMGMQLFEAANEPKKFINIPGGTHNDFPPPYYFIEIDQFVQGL